MKSKIRKNDNRFYTSYNLAFDYHVKPQEFTRNDLVGDKTTTIKVKESQKQISQYETQKLKKLQIQK